MSPAEIKARVWHSIDQVWNQGDLSASAETFAPIINLHFRGSTHPLTMAQLNTIVSYWREAYPDFHFNLDDIVIDGDRAALRLTFTGTHLGEGFGGAATGNRVTVSEMLICRLKDDKIVEMWEEYDELGMRQQLGLLPLPVDVN